jgi:hypothetical protein
MNSSLIRLFGHSANFPVSPTYLIRDRSIQLGSQYPSIWVPLHELWKHLTSAQSVENNLDPQLVISVARFTRNLIADVPFNQKNA